MLLSANITWANIGKLNLQKFPQATLNQNYNYKAIASGLAGPALAGPHFSLGK